FQVPTPGIGLLRAVVDAAGADRAVDVREPPRAAQAPHPVSVSSVGGHQTEPKITASSPAGFARLAKGRPRPWTIARPRTALPTGARRVRDERHRFEPEESRNPSASESARSSPPWSER